MAVHDHEPVPFGFYMLPGSQVATPPRPALAGARRHRQVKTAAAAAEADAQAAAIAVGTALFRRFDKNRDGALCVEEMRDAAAVMFPDQHWDDSLWEQFCAEFQVDTERGFELENFLHLRESVDEEEGVPEDAPPPPLPGLEWPDDWPPAEVRVATAAFVRHDTDGNSHLSAAEMRCLAAEEYPAEDWDDAAWEPMCEHLGVQPGLGLNFEAFLRFRLSHIEAAAAEAWTAAVGEEGAEHMSMEQLKEWATSGTGAEAAAEEWDDALWPELCESYGADAADGLSCSAFTALFRAQRAATEAAAQLAEAQAAAQALARRVAAEQAREAEQQQRQIFGRFDLDRNGYLDRDEMAAAARQLYPREAWEEDVWEEFCSFLGANPELGLTPPMFSAFREQMEEVEAAERKEFERCDANAFCACLLLVGSLSPRRLPCVYEQRVGHAGPPPCFLLVPLRSLSAGR